MKNTIIHLILCCTIIGATASCGEKSAAATASAAVDNSTDSAAVIAGPAKTQLLTMAFVGDIIMGSTFPDSVHGSMLPADGGSHLFDHCRDIFRRADVTCGNLEGSFLDGPGKRRPMTNPKTYFIFRMPTTYVSNLVDAGFDFIGIANNHINDFGEPGRQSTTATIRDAGLGVSGLRGKCEVAYATRGGHRIAFAQFGHGDNNLDVTDMDQLRRTVATMRDSADIVVIGFHGGAEGSAYSHIPFAPEVYVGERRGNVVEFAHTAIDAGADVVFGHGPHVPRAAELYKGHIIFYSLGNFCTPYGINIGGLTGYAPLAEVTIDPASGKFLAGRIHSFRQQRGQGPQPDTTNAVAAHIRRLTLDDFPATPLQIDPDGRLEVGSPPVATAPDEVGSPPVATAPDEVGSPPVATAPTK